MSATAPNLSVVALASQQALPIDEHGLKTGSRENVFTGGTTGVDVHHLKVPVHGHEDHSPLNLEIDLSMPPPSRQAIRRRSDAPRTRPADLRGLKFESYELPIISSTIGEVSPLPTPILESERDVVIGPSLPTSEAPSLRIDIGDDANSTTPTFSSTQQAQHRWKARLHLAALFWCFFLEGWNDGSTGPLLPTIQNHYGIGFAIVSLLFVSNTVGFLSGAFMNVYLSDRFGFGKLLTFGSALQLIAYAMISPGGPFPVMCVAFVFSGFGIALQNAQGNGFVGSLKDDPVTKIGFLHASYGLGAFAAPLVATQFANSTHWSYHYLVSAGLAVTNVLFLTYVFKLKNQDDVLTEAGQLPGESEDTRQNKYAQIMKIKSVHLMACWALIYVGVEVTLGGWIVTFIEEKRGGGASAGYISSGFFGGLMLGRVLLMWLNRKIGERRVMFIYTFLAIQFEITIWVVPSLIENALAIACIGLLLGPMYPILVNQSRAVFPKWLFTGCVGWIAGVGQAGSAILPFMTGVLASKFGISSLQPFVVSMMSTLIVIWAFVPRVRRVD